MFQSFFQTILLSMDIDLNVIMVAWLKYIASDLYLKTLSINNLRKIC